MQLEPEWSRTAGGALTAEVPDGKLRSHEEMDGTMPTNRNEGVVAQGRATWMEPTKGLAILLVVGYHSTLYLQAEGMDVVLGRAKAAFELFPMPAFFLIAGMFAARQKAFTLRALWRRRLLQLVYLYVVWSIIRALFYLTIPGLNGELGELSATDPRAVLLLLVWPSSSYWFLWALCLFTLVYWGVARAPAWAQLAGSGVVSVLFSARWVEVPNLGWNRVGALFFFFVLGAVASGRIRAAVARAEPVHLVLATAGFLLVSALIALGWRWVPPVVLAGQLLAVAAGVQLCRLLIRFRVFGFLSRVGTDSLRLYLLHLYVIVPAAALLGSLELDLPRGAVLGVQLGLTAVTVLAAGLLGRLTGRARWLYLPPAFLRNSRLGGADAPSSRRAPATTAGEENSLRLQFPRVLPSSSGAVPGAGREVVTDGVDGAGSPAATRAAHPIERSPM